MKRIGIFAVLMVMAFMLMAGMHLTFHAGEVSADSQGDSNARHRYGTLSKTPITDLDKLNGVTSNVQDQIDAAGTGSLAIANAFVGSTAGVATAKSVTIINDVTATLDENGVLNATIPASTINSSMIAIANVATSDIADSAVTSDKIAIANVQASDMFINTVSLVIEAGATTNTVAVEAGSQLLYVLPSSGFSNDYTMINSSYGGGADAANIFRVDTDAHPADMIVDTGWIRP